MENESLFRNRRTVRLYEQRQVADELLEKVLDAARLAPCAANRQRLRYVVARTPEIVSKLLPLTKWAMHVSPHRTPVQGESGPAAFIAVIGPREGNAYIHADAGAAIGYIQLAASCLGLGSCWLASVEREEAAAVLGLSVDEELLYLVSVGYPAEKPVLDDNASETAYYLDDAGVLHVRKLPLDVIARWM